MESSNPNPLPADSHISQDRQDLIFLPTESLAGSSPWSNIFPLSRALGPLVHAGRYALGIWELLFRRHHIRSSNSQNHNQWLWPFTDSLLRDKHYTKCYTYIKHNFQAALQARHTCSPISVRKLKLGRVRPLPRLYKWLRQRWQWILSHKFFPQQTDNRTFTSATRHTDSLNLS